MFRKRHENPENETYKKVQQILDLLSKIDANTDKYWDFQHVYTSVFNTFSRDNNVTFAFSLEFIGDGIKIWNFHREAKPRNGTTALKSLEVILGKLATSKNIKIEITFPTFNQTDT